MGSAFLFYFLHSSCASVDHKQVDQLFKPLETNKVLFSSCVNNLQEMQNTLFEAQNTSHPFDKQRGSFDKQ